MLLCRGSKTNLVSAPRLSLAYLLRSLINSLLLLLLNPSNPRALACLVSRDSELAYLFKIFD